MKHIGDTCLLTKFEGGLNREADESTVTAALAK